jgi:hypothetical protein
LRAELAALIAAQPWQEIIGPPKQKVTAIGSSRPSTSSRHGPMKRYRTRIRVYVKREGDHYLFSCIYDIHGELHYR